MDIVAGASAYGSVGASDGDGPDFAFSLKLQRRVEGSI
jgi:hypothetical protein